MHVAELRIEAPLHPAARTCDVGRRQLGEAERPRHRPAPEPRAGRPGTQQLVATGIGTYLSFFIKAVS